jgi:hypothetical protein
VVAVMSLRYHIISIAAVFLALAAGVVLGSTNVSQRLLAVVAGDRDGLTQQVEQLGAQRDQLQARQRAAKLFTESVAPTVLKGQLSQRKVVLVLAPGASAADRDGVRQMLGDAGATVTGELTLTDAALDPARADQVRDLTTRLLPSGAQLPSATDAGGLAGGLLGSVLLLGPHNGKPQAAPDQASAALAGLTQAGFVRPGPAPAPAQLAVVLTGDQVGGADAAERAATLARLAGELDRAGSGAVLAGRSGSDGATGAVGVVRADASAEAKLSTVDDVQDPLGQVATVLALREQASGQAGRYGSAGNAQGPIPGASAG